MQIFKLTFTHKDWPHPKCAYIPCTDMEMAKRRARELNEENHAEHCKVALYEPGKM